MLLTYLSVGVINVMCKETTLNAFINSIKYGKTAWAATVPLVWEALIRFMKGKYGDEETATLKDILGDSLKFCICGGAHTSPKVIKQFNESKIIFCECYGMTEAGMISLNIGHEIVDRTNGSVGNINNTSCKVKLLTETGKIEKFGMGELIVAGKGLYVSTLKNGVEIPRDVSKLDGFIETGDLVEIKDGNIYFRDRIKDVIINSNGENICPGELEKTFDFLLNEDIQFTIVGINNFPAIVIYCSKKQMVHDQKAIIEAITAANKALPISKRIVAIYFTQVKFPVTSALKIRKFQLRKQIERNQKDYVKVDLIKKNVSIYTMENIKQSIRDFFSIYLNIARDKIKDNTSIIEELDVDSLVMADFFVYIQEKYGIDLDIDFMLNNSLTISYIAEKIFTNLNNS